MIALDRIEGNVAVLVDDTGATLDYPLRSLPKAGRHAGAVFTVTSRGRLSYSRKAEAQALARARSAFQSLPQGPAGNIDLGAPALPQGGTSENHLVLTGAPTINPLVAMGGSLVGSLTGSAGLANVATALLSGNVGAAAKTAAGMAGAAVGSAILPGVGTIVGAIAAPLLADAVGALGNALGGEQVIYQPNYAATKNMTPPTQNILRS